MLLITGALAAQNRSATVEQAVLEKTELYQLTDEQVKELYVIEERHERNLNEIETLRESEYLLFLQKRKVVVDHTNGSLRQILNEEQRQTFYQQEVAKRRTRSEDIRELRAAGKSKQEIELILLERY